MHAKDFPSTAKHAQKLVVHMPGLPHGTEICALVTYTHFIQGWLRGLTTLQRHTMADSIYAFIPIPPMPDEEYRACKYPGKALLNLDLSGSSGSIFNRWISVVGLALGNKFKIRGRWQGDPNDLRLAGYEFSINVPACTVGSNPLLVNGVPCATGLGVLLVKCWLRDHGCSYKGIDVLDVEAVELLSTTPTFLHQLNSRANADKARDDFIIASEIRNCETTDFDKQSTNKAFSQGNSKDRTAYLRERTHLISAYVKRRTTKSKAVFPNASVRHQIFDEAESQLRLEVETHESWLKENQLSRVEDWRLYGDERAYRLVYALIRSGLRLDEGLRSRKPKNADIEKLYPVDQAVLRWHLDGDDKHQARKHPVILAKLTKLAQQQYFSEIKLRIKKELRVDISVPWEKQAASASTGLNNLLHYPGLYRPPEHLEAYVFSPKSVQQMMHKLKVHLDRDRPRGIGRTHIDPETLEPPPVRLGQILVSSNARQLLDHYRLPLHHFLASHQWGVFGDVSLDEVLRLAGAAADLEPVRSRYRVGPQHVTVTTSYVQQSDGQLMPVTMVCWECEHE